MRPCTPPASPSYILSAADTELLQCIIYTVSREILTQFLVITHLKFSRCIKFCHLHNSKETLFPWKSASERILKISVSHCIYRLQKFPPFHKYVCNICTIPCKNSNAREIAEATVVLVLLLTITASSADTDKVVCCISITVIIITLL